LASLTRLGVNQVQQDRHRFGPVLESFVFGELL